MRSGGAALALAAATLFAVSVPAAKFLLASADPLWIAGGLYAGSGVVLGGWIAVRCLVAPRPAAVVRSRTWLRLAGAILAGGVAAPLCLLSGLSRLPASTASMALALEAPLTGLIAWASFGEPLGWRAVGALGLIAAGAGLLAGPLEAVGAPAGLAMVGAAAFLWALDNNLTREASDLPATRVAALKGLAGGGTNLALAVLVGAPRPAAAAMALILAVGGVSYGLSLSLYVTSLRLAGAARAGAYFGTAPLLAAAMSVPFLGEAVSPRLLVAAVLTGVGVALLAGERHGHRHRHDAIEHVHRHHHDEHHRHVHEGGEGPEPHSHRHRHDDLWHDHSHLPDLHHRHGH